MIAAGRRRAHRGRRAGLVLALSRRPSTRPARSRKAPSLQPPLVMSNQVAGVLAGIEQALGGATGPAPRRPAPRRPRDAPQAPDQPALPRCGRPARWRPCLGASAPPRRPRAALRTRRRTRSSPCRVAGRPASLTVGPYFGRQAQAIEVTGLARLPENVEPLEQRRDLGEWTVAQEHCGAVCD